MKTFLSFFLFVIPVWANGQDKTKYVPADNATFSIHAEKYECFFTYQKVSLTYSGVRENVLPHEAAGIDERLDLCELKTSRQDWWFESMKLQFIDKDGFKYWLFVDADADKVQADRLVANKTYTLYVKFINDPEERFDFLDDLEAN